MPGGSCLCGEARYEVTGWISPIQHCHCGRCRKATGGAAMSAVAVRREDFRYLTGGDRVQLYAAPLVESPPPYRRGFCRLCGSPMPVLDPDDPWVVIPAGSFDDDPGTRPFRHIFVGRKAPWHEILDGLPQHEGHAPAEQQLPRE